jgi:hypothetical protein
MWVAVTSSTALLIATDAKTYEPSKKFYDSDPAKAFYSRLFAELGDGRSQFGLSAAFALYGWAANDLKALKVASQIAEVVPCFRYSSPSLKAFNRKRKPHRKKFANRNVEILAKPN